MYRYKTINNLQHGQHFQFKSGATINQVVLKQRNLLIYTNILTGKTRRKTGFMDGKITKPVIYVKMLDEMFNKYYDKRHFIETSLF